MRRALVAFSILVFALTATSRADKTRALGEPVVISRIRKDLPNAWQCAVLHQNGEKGHPHGLKEPLFRADFSAPKQSLTPPKGDRRGNLSPLIQLYFYNIRHRSHVLEVIEEERVYSWDIPIYFGETEDYIIVTSPPYVNHGIFTEEAKQAIRPMWNVLRKHIENKGHETVQQLAQPNK
jgi:hypothetical protein